MANKILTNVYDYIGNTYPSDVYVKNDTTLNNTNLENLRINISLIFYKSKEDYQDGFKSFIAIVDKTSKIPIVSFAQMLTPEQAMTINPTMVQGFVTDYLKTIYNEDVSPAVNNVEEVY